MIYFTKVAAGKLGLNKSIGKFDEICIKSEKKPRNIYVYRRNPNSTNTAEAIMADKPENKLSKIISFGRMTSNNTSCSNEELYFYDESFTSGDNLDKFAKKFAKILEENSLAFIGLRRNTGKWDALILDYKEQEQYQKYFAWTNHRVSLVTNEEMVKKFSPRWIQF